mgnify:CR=1 FL=1
MPRKDEGTHEQIGTMPLGREGRAVYLREDYKLTRERNHPLGFHVPDAKAQAGPDVARAQRRTFRVLQFRQGTHGLR